MLPILEQHPNSIESDLKDNKKNHNLITTMINELTKTLLLKESKFLSSSSILALSFSISTLKSKFNIIMPNKLIEGLIVALSDFDNFD